MMHRARPMQVGRMSLPLKRLTGKAAFEGASFIGKTSLSNQRHGQNELRANIMAKLYQGSDATDDKRG